MRKAVLTSFLADDIEAYISYKLSLGFVFDEGRRALVSFDAMCANDFPDEVELTREVAMRWAGLRDGEHPNTRRGRVSAVRGLAEYMIRQGKPAYVIPRNSLSPASPYVPYIYTRGEIAALLEACDALAGSARPGECKLMLPCAIKLLYATGMRHGELRRLGRSDVDLGRGEISIGPSELPIPCTSPME